jgi:iron(III) transport system substrate-binding protein
VRPHGDWVGTRLNVFVQAYNTNWSRRKSCRKPGRTCPPRWKGRLGIEQEDQDWFSGIATDIGEARAVKVFKDIVATNGIRCARATPCSPSSSSPARSRSR